MKLAGDSIWLATQPDDKPNFVPGWLLELDRRTGKLLGHVDVTGVHGMDALRDGELFVGPGSNQDSPQWLRPLSTAAKHE